MEVPRIPLNFKPDSDRSFEDYMGQDVPVSSSEATIAAFTLATQDTASMLIGRQLVASDFEGRGVGKISAEEANQRFPEMHTPFREPVNPYMAQLQFDKQQRDMELQRKVENGPDDAWTKTKIFGAGLLAHLMDPIETGASAMLSWGVGGMATKGFFGAKTAAAAKAVQAGTAGFGARAGVRALETVTGDLTQNIGQEILLGNTISREGGEYNPETGELLTDLALNTAGGAGFFFGVREGFTQFSKLFRMLKSTSPQADLAIARTVVGNLDNDVRPNITPILESLAKETSVKPQEFGLPHYNYEPVDTTNVVGKKFYISTVDTAPDAKSGIKTALGDDFGMGTHLTDNPGVANAASSRGMADNMGAVHEVTFNENNLNPLSLDAPVPESMQGLLAKADLPPEAPLRDVLSVLQSAMDEGDLPDNFMDSVKQQMLDNGYNALISNGEKHMGVDHTPHNHITLLDDNLIEQTGTYSPNPAVKAEIQHEVITKAMEHSQDYKNHTLVESTKFDEMMKSLDETPGQTIESSKLRDNIQEQIDSISELDNQKLLSSDEKKMFESLKEEFKDLDIKHTLVKAVASCVGG